MSTADRVQGHPLLLDPSQSREHRQPQMFSQDQNQNQNQQFHGPPWQQSQPIQPAPQMQAHGLSNLPQYQQNPNVVPFDFSSVVSQQIMRDFLRLSTPVGSSPNDDTILAQALHESRQTGKTYRQALESLHGVNDHAANLWKDYYLDHHDRFDFLVSRLAEQPKTVKKPFVAVKPPTQTKQEGTSDQVARKRHLSHTQPSSPRQASRNKGQSSGPLHNSRRKRAANLPLTTTSSALVPPPKRPRATVNSLTAPLLSSDVPNLMPPQVHIPLPDPPSRYTKEDREYFLKFLMWRLKQDPSLTKKEICELLHKKAPHHSANSWASHWHQRHDIADKIFAAYHNSSDADEDEEQQDEDGDEEVEVEAEMKDDHEDDDAQSEEMSADETLRGYKGHLRSEGTFSDFGDPDVDTEEDEADMGEPGSSFTQGDWCILARFIAKNHWNEMSSKERWQTFTETHGTKRSVKCWAEFYRKNEAEILRLSKRYSPESSRGNQSWRRRRDRRRVSQELDLDKDGEYETDDEED